MYVVSWFYCLFHVLFCTFKISNVENLSPQTIRRLVREQEELIKDPPEGIRIVVNDSDVTDIQAFIDGPGMFKTINVETNSSEWTCFVLITQRVHHMRAVGLMWSWCWVKIFHTHHQRHISLPKFSIPTLQAAVKYVSTLWRGIGNKI